MTIEDDIIETKKNSNDLLTTALPIIDNAVASSNNLEELITTAIIGVVSVMVGGFVANLLHRE